jgi:hypothetical protein
MSGAAKHNYTSLLHKYRTLGTQGIIDRASQVLRVFII